MPILHHSPRHVKIILQYLSHLKVTRMSANMMILKVLDPGVNSIYSQKVKETTAAYLFLKLDFLAGKI